MVIHEILNCFYSPARKGILVIGIDGLGGSGKTTYAKSMEQTLSNKGIQVKLLHIDDFIHRNEIRYDDSRADWECYYYLQWRYDYLIEEILAPVQEGNSIDKQIELYDKQADQYRLKNIKMAPNSILIIEGVFLQRTELAPYFDYVAFIDVPKEERLQRVLKRDTYIGNDIAIIEKYENRYFPAEDKYIEDFSPAERANWLK